MTDKNWGQRREGIIAHDMMWIWIWAARIALLCVTRSASPVQLAVRVRLLGLQINKVWPAGWIWSSKRPSPYYSWTSNRPFLLLEAATPCRLAVRHLPLNFDLFTLNHSKSLFP